MCTFSFRFFRVFVLPHFVSCPDLANALTYTEGSLSLSLRHLWVPLMPSSAASVTLRWPGVALMTGCRSIEQDLGVNSMWISQNIVKDAKACQNMTVHMYFENARQKSANWCTRPYKKAITALTHLPQGPGIEKLLVDVWYVCIVRFYCEC